MEQRICVGDFVSHFKRGERANDDLMHCYVVIDDDVMYTESGERCVVYQALYGEYKKFCRPYDMFMSEVDKESYPNASQTYRLEKITNLELLENIQKVFEFLNWRRENIW